MSDISAPKRILRRAANLLTSNGQPTAEELVFDQAPPPTKSSSFSGSIKRKIRQVKAGGLTRSRSTSVVLNSVRSDPGQRHKPRANSESLAKSPMQDTIQEHWEHPESSTDITVPQLLQVGTPMTKVSNKKHKRLSFRVDPDQGQIVWQSKTQKISKCLS